MGLCFCNANCQKRYRVTARNVQIRFSLVTQTFFVSRKFDVGKFEFPMLPKLAKAVSRKFPFLLFFSFSEVSAFRSSHFYEFPFLREKLAVQKTSRFGHSTLFLSDCATSELDENFQIPSDASKLLPTRFLSVGTIRKAQYRTNCYCGDLGLSVDDIQTFNALFG